MESSLETILASLGFTHQFSNLEIPEETRLKLTKEVFQFKNSIKKTYKAISNAKIDLALEVLGEIFRSEFLNRNQIKEPKKTIKLISFRWSDLKNALQKNLMSRIDAEVPKAQIVQSLLEVLEELQELFLAEIQEKILGAKNLLNYEGSGSRIDMVFTLDGNFKDFNLNKRSQFLKALEELLSTGGSLSIKLIQEGSIIIKIELVLEWAAELIVKINNEFRKNWSISRIELENSNYKQKFFEKNQVNQSISDFSNWLERSENPGLINIIAKQLYNTPNFNSNIYLGKSEIKERLLIDLKRPQDISAQDWQITISNIQEELNDKQLELNNSIYLKKKILGILQIIVTIGLFLFASLLIFFPFNQMNIIIDLLLFLIMIGLIVWFVKLKKNIILDKQILSVFNRENEFFIRYSKKI